MNYIVTEPTATAQWQQLVLEAEESAHLNLNETLESYLVFTLIRFTQRPQLLNGIMALEFLNGLNEQGTRRRDNLRDVGDQCLLFAGLFPHNARRRRVRIGYFVQLGRSAYQQIHDDQKDAAFQLYGQLATDFIAMMDVLLAIRSLNPSNSVLAPLDAFELWEETGSQQAHATLTQKSGAKSVLINDGKTTQH
jgi:hypothetical protein